MDTKSAKSAVDSKPEAEVEADQVDDKVAKQTSKVPEPEKFVEYTGQATRRILVPEDWERVGLSGEKNVWGMHNAFKIPVSDFTKDQLDYLLHTDGKFKVV